MLIWNINGRDYVSLLKYPLCNKAYVIYLQISLLNSPLRNKPNVIYLQFPLCFSVDVYAIIYFLFDAAYFQDL